MTASRSADRKAEFWDNVKFDNESRELHVQQVFTKPDLTQGALNSARLRFGWTRRQVPQVNRKQIIKRLFDLKDRMPKELEGQVTATGERKSPSSDGRCTRWASSSTSRRRPSPRLSP